MDAEALDTPVLLADSPLLLTRAETAPVTGPEITSCTSGAILIRSPCMLVGHFLDELFLDRLSPLPSVLDLVRLLLAEVEFKRDLAHLLQRVL